MRNTEFEIVLLDMKKARFISAVKNASKYLKTSPPEVKFWKGSCPENTGRELAHIHIERKLICVSEYRLKQMDFDDIDKTATHELSHIKEVSHSTKFHSIHSEVQTGRWVAEKQIQEYKNPILKQAKRSKLICHHNPCRNKKSVQCQYCKETFCEHHIQPKRPGMRNFERNRVSDMILGTEKDGHPCVPWIISKEKEEIITKKRYEESLNILLSKRKSYEHQEDIAPMKEEIRATKTKENKKMFYRKPPKDDGFRFKKSWTLNKLKCILGHHEFIKVGETQQFGNGKFYQKNRCKFCGLTQEITN